MNKRKKREEHDDNDDDREGDERRIPKKSRPDIVGDETVPADEGELVAC